MREFRPSHSGSNLLYSPLAVLFGFVIGSSRLLRAIAELHAHRIITLIDHEETENTGYLMTAAERITHKAINFMARFRPRFDLSRLDPLVPGDTTPQSRSMILALPYSGL